MGTATSFPPDLAGRKRCQPNPRQTPPSTLNLLDEYPRWLKKEHEISGEIGQVPPIEAVFALADAERAELADKFGEGVVPDPTVTCRRRYGADSFEVDIAVDHVRFVKPFVESVPARLQPRLGACTTASDLFKAFAVLINAAPSDDPEVTALAADADVANSRLAEMLGNTVGLEAAVAQVVRAWVPRTFYFSNYAQLRGRYPLQEVFNAVKGGSDDESIQAAADFLELARVVPATIEDWDYEASNSELEAVSSLLTKRVKAHWKQNDHLKLRVSLETQQSGAGVPGGVDRYLQFRVEDTRHDFSNRLDRRSTGFQWFVSFMASFLEFEKDKNLILLFDEPGLSLHARAQMDLLGTIEDSLADGRQIIYSTHSPFMVKPNRLNQARIVEDQGEELGSTVINDAGVVSDPDTLFPLQAALGYDLVQSLFIGSKNVLVEGVSDFIYLTMMSDHLGGLGRASLPVDCRLLPAGGATNIPTFIALLGGKLDFVVLVDGNTSSQKFDNTVRRGRLQESRIISVDRFVEVPGADIEDLFTPAEYVKFYNRAFSRSVALADLTGSDRIVKRIARADGGEFNHGVVAADFLRHLASSVKALSAGTLERFEAVITAVAAELPSD